VANMGYTSKKKNMKRVALFCVSYESDNELETYRQSLEKASNKAGEKIDLDIFVAKNTKENNPGYFGAIKKLMQNVDIKSYHYFIISNVDLTVEENFFIKLADYNCTENIGWIAPQIWSAQESRDLNPKIQSRYPYYKIRALQFLHKHPYLHNIYSKTLYKRKRVHSSEERNIYAGHGSFIILTKEYVEECGIIDYPIFLFCEELYLAESCRKSNLFVKYVPNLKVYDREHVSTSHMPVKEYSYQNYNAVSYIINKFYK